MAAGDATARDAVLRKALARLDALEARAREPIAIIGMACRFPGGANDPDAFWRLLFEGRDAVGRVPADRWDADALYDPDPDALGKITTREGAFLDGIELFDAEFFGIAPREARAMDPQHRLLLEVAWEALEHAGYRPDAVAGMAGVFIGIASNNYAQLVTEVGEIDAYGGLGAALSAAPGRIAYTLGLNGPAVALDAACASSLAAVHLACQALRGGECDVALAGGVNAILTPFGHQFLARAKVLSPDGRCKSFSAAADGIGRGEGCGIVVLKRLADARRDGDPVLAAVLGSAVEQDGRSSGLTVPNGIAQARLIREALRRAGLPPAAVDVIEAHGTGTPLGDPIEAEALGEVFAPGRPANRPLVVGSVKTNLAHLEAAAGIAGLIKTVLALRRGCVPPILHLGAPNPRLDWRGLPVLLPCTPHDWPPAARQRVAGVSAFGLTGTIAHVVLGDPPAAPAMASPGGAPAASPVATAPARPDASAVEPPLHVLPLSARSPAALETLRARHMDALAQSRGCLADYCFTAGVGRKPQPHRLAVVGRDAGEVRTALAEANAGTASPRPRLAFLFTGQGAHWRGMGAALPAHESAFRAVVQTCAAALAHEPALRGHSLFDLLGRTEEGLERTDIAQPVLFTLQTGLVALWRSWGVVPDILLGHSAGEVAAAVAAGLIGLEDGARFAARRGAAMAAMPAGGAMAAVFAPGPEVAAAIAAKDSGLAIAARNGPNETVVSGNAAEVTALCAALAETGVRSRDLSVAYAFHSSQLDPVLDRIDSAAGFLPQRPAERTLLCNLDGLRLQPGDRLPPGYWRRQAREPVAFDRVLEGLAAAAPVACIEIGPQPTLLALVRRAGRRLADVPCLPSLRREDVEANALRESLAALHCLGAPIDWAGVYHGQERHRIALPTTPFQRRRHWVDAALAHAPEPTAPLPGRRSDSPLGDWCFETVLDPARDAALDQHRLRGVATFPAAALVTLARDAAIASGLPWTPALSALRLVAPLSFPEDRPRLVRTALAPDGNGLHLVVASKGGPSPQGEGEHEAPTWTIHAEAHLVRADSLPAATLPAGLSLVPVSPDRYVAAAQAGVTLGPEYRRLATLGACDGGTAGEVGTPEETALTAPMLDACFQVAAACIQNDGLWIPTGIDHALVPSVARFPLLVVARPKPGPAREYRFGLALHDAAGTLVGAVEGLAFQRAARPVPSTPVYRMAWQKVPCHAAGPLGPILVTGACGNRAAALLAQAGACLVSGIDAAKAVLWAPSADAPDLLAHAAAIAAEVRACPGVRLWIVLGAGEAPSVMAGALRGFAATLAVEQPESWGGLIEIDNGSASEATVLAHPADMGPANRTALALSAALAGSEPLVTIRDGQLHVARLERAAVPDVALRLTEDAAWFITGGLGGVGRSIAAALVDAGLRRLVLVSRSFPTDAEHWADTLRERGATVAIEAADVTDHAALAGVLARVADRGWRLSGVAHLAAIGDAALLAQRDPASLAAIAAPKIAGAWHLHTLTRHLPLEHFVLFSSLSGVLGVPGQAGYAAGNAFLDALAGYRNALGLPAVSIAWDAWQGTGLATQLPTGSAGMPLDPQAAATCFLHLADGVAGPNPIVSAQDFAAYRRKVPQAAGLLAAFADTSPPDMAPPAAISLQATPAEQRHALLAELARAAAKVMRLPPGDSVPVGISLFEAGLDSLMATELAAELARRLGRPIGPTIVYDHPSLAELADHLSDAAPAPSADGLEARVRTLTDDQIAAEIAARFAVEDEHG
jgi:acyl transferase domain-containing protein